MDKLFVSNPEDTEILFDKQSEYEAVRTLDGADSASAFSRSDFSDAGLSSGVLASGADGE